MIDQIAYFLTIVTVVGVAFLGAYVLFALLHLPLYFKGKR